MNDARMPVLIGAGQITDKRGPETASTPVELMAEVARRAAADAGPGDALLQAIDTIVALKLVVDSPESALVVVQPDQHGLPQVLVFGWYGLDGIDRSRQDGNPVRPLDLLAIALECTGPEVSHHVVGVAGHSVSPYPGIG